MKYTYSFQVWPDETKDWGTLGMNQPMAQLLIGIGGRLEMEFTEKEFASFRRVLGNNWITLREITRVPHVEPESIT